MDQPSAAERLTTCKRRIIEKTLVVDGQLEGSLMSRGQLEDEEVQPVKSLLVGVPTFLDSGAERSCPASSEDDANTLVPTHVDEVVKYKGWRSGRVCDEA